MPSQQDGIPRDMCAMWDIQIYLITDSAWPWAAGLILQPNPVCILRGAGTDLLLHPWRIKPRWQLAGARAPAAGGGCHLLWWMWVTGTRKSPFTLVPSPWKLQRGPGAAEEPTLGCGSPNTCTRACTSTPGSTRCCGDACTDTACTDLHTRTQSRAQVERMSRTRAHASQYVHAHSDAHKFIYPSVHG